MSLDDFDNVWVSELIFAVDAQTQAILDVTGDVEACLGSSPELLVGLPLFVSIHRDDLQMAQAAFKRTVDEGRAVWEGRVQKVDGTFVRYGWEGRLGLDRKTIYARSRDVDRVRATVADMRVYERLADLTPDLLIVVNNEGRIVQANEAAAKAHNVSEEDFIGTLLSDYVREEGQRVLEEIPRRMIQGESVIDFRLPVYDGVGGQVTMEGTATFDDVTSRWYIVERDVTERVAREEELEITQRFFDLSASQLVLVDADDCVVRANRSFLDLAGWAIGDVEGRHILDALRVVGGNEVRSLLEQVRQGHAVEALEVRVRVGGAPRTLEVQLSAAIDGGAVYLSCRDVTEERSLRAELFRRATRDALTGLANRPSLLEAIEADLKSGTFVALIMLDLDGFKRINDSLGHAAGDALLVGIAERLDQRTRGVDMVARLGGDEFVLLLRGVPDLATVELVGEKIRQAFHEPFDVLGRAVEIFASVGATGGHRTSHTSEELLLQADIAAYSAKRAGADRCSVFDDELRNQADFVNAVEEHLRRVLSAPDFDLNVVAIKGPAGESIGVGVIAPAVAVSGERRWNQQSMRVAKDLGLLGSISTRMTNEAIRQLKSWLLANPESYLEIVYDVAEVSMAGFLPMLMEALDENDVGANQFVVSLTGHGEAGAEAIDPASIDALRASGVRVALAESSADAHTLSVIASIGIDRIDVDVAHVAATGEGSVKRLIANTVLDIADRLGITIMIDASFTPDVVDVMKVFRDSSPVGVVFEAPVPLGTFLGAAGPMDAVCDGDRDDEELEGSDEGSTNRMSDQS